LEGGGGKDATRGETRGEERKKEQKLWKMGSISGAEEFEAEIKKKKKSNGVTSGLRNKGQKEGNHHPTTKKVVVWIGFPPRVKKKL